jgi:hypothetical protein
MVHGDTLLNIHQNIIKSNTNTCFKMNDLRGPFVIEGLHNTPAPPHTHTPTPLPPHLFIHQIKFKLCKVSHGKTWKSLLCLVSIWIAKPHLADPTWYSNLPTCYLPTTIFYKKLYIGSDMDKLHEMKLIKVQEVKRHMRLVQQYVVIECGDLNKIEAIINLMVQ